MREQDGPQKMKFYQKTYFFQFFILFRFKFFIFIAAFFLYLKFFFLTLTPVSKVKSLNLDKSVFIPYLTNSLEHSNQTSHDYILPSALEPRYKILTPLLKGQ